MTETLIGKYGHFLVVIESNVVMFYCWWNSSPWSNKYTPALEDGFLPSEKLRALEVEFNELFDAYRELYYEGGTSSVYLWDLEEGFAGCFLIKKSK